MSTSASILILATLMVTAYGVGRAHQAHREWRYWVTYWETLYGRRRAMAGLFRPEPRNVTPARPLPNGSHLDVRV